LSRHRGRSTDHGARAVPGEGLSPLAIIEASEHDERGGRELIQYSSQLSAMSLRAGRRGEHTMGGEGFPVETFDEVLRDLLTCGLVARVTGNDSRGWQLVARAQQRLEELAIAVGPWPVERTVYLYRECADCRKRHLTWVRKDSNLCDLCSQRRLAPRAEPASITPRFPGWSLIIGNEFLDPKIGEPTESLRHHVARRPVDVVSQSPTRSDACYVPARN